MSLYLPYNFLQYDFEKFIRTSVQNDQNSQLKLTFGTHTNSSLQNLMVMFTFSVFEWKVLFKHAQLDFYIC